MIRSFSNRRLGERGFTLIELLVVASILVVLASLGLVQYKNGVTRSRFITIDHCVGTV